MKIFLAGGTGAIGRQLVPLLVTNGHAVTAITRSPANLEMLESQGASATICDVFERERLLRLVTEARPDVIIHQLTSIPPQMHPRRVRRDMAETNRLRTDGTRMLLDAAGAAGTRRMITQSIAFVYRPDGQEPATEGMPLFRDAPMGFADMVDAVEQSEYMTLQTPGIQGTVLRYGYFYGPGTIYARDGTFARSVRDRQVPIVGGGNGVFSFVHVSDAASATVAVLEQASAGIYNVVDDEPARVDQWLPYYAELLGAKPPFRAPRLAARLIGGSYSIYLMTQQRGVSNAFARSELGWRPQYASWREGFRAELTPV